MSDMKVVEINGIKYSVTSALAEQLEKERQANEKKNRETSEKLKQLEALAKNPPARDPNKDQNRDNEGLDYGRLGQQIFVDPEGTIKEIVEKTEQRMEKKYNAAEAAKQQASEDEKALDRFYTDFFAKNKDLKDERELVESRLQYNWGRWKTLTRDEVMENLEKDVTAIILRLRKQPGGKEGEGEENSRQDFLVEGQSLNPADDSAGKGKGKGDEEEEDAKNSSLTKTLKARKEARRKAAHGIT